MLFTLTQCGSILLTVPYTITYIDVCYTLHSERFITLSHCTLVQYYKYGAFILEDLNLFPTFL